MENNDKNYTYIVYCTTNIITKYIYIGVHKLYDGEPLYLGNGCRINHPSDYAHPKTKFQAALKKYGPKNFIRTTIKDFGDDEEGAYLLEAELVDENFLARPDVYNMVLGGKSSWIYNSKKLYQYDLDGNLIATHENLKDASISVKRHMSCVWMALRGKSKCANSFWSYKKYDKLDVSLFKKEEFNRGTPVYQFSECGEYECCYESIRSCARIIGVNDSNIRNAMILGTKCNGKYFSPEFAQNYSISKNEKIKNTIVYQYDEDGNYIRSWESANKARKALKFTSDIYKAIRLGQMAGGFQWSLEKLPRLSKHVSKIGNKRKVGKYDTNGNLLKVYDTLAEAVRVEGSGLRSVLRGRDLTHKGNVYKYINR